ncbi:MAG: T9SS type A sorting domain-containing protein [Bacteroidales bacterium]|nr:T9SS type A sorting domain-containing protein [Bacteroidales bacterium]
MAKDFETTALNDYLGLTYLDDGTEWEITQLEGAGLSLTDQLEFNYYGGTDAHYSIDRMGTTSGEVLLACEESHGRMIMNEGENYTAVSSSAIFGAIANGEGLNLKPYLMAELINQFLGLNSVFSLNLTASPEEGGTVDGSGDFMAGSQVEVSATPAIGWEFVNWTNLMGMIISTDSIYSFQMPASTITLIANFIPLTGQVEFIVPALVSAYPNPFNNKVSLDFDPSFIGSEFSIIDLTGRIVLSGMIRSEKMHLDFSKINSGVFMLNIPAFPFKPIRIMKR